MAASPFALARMNAPCSTACVCRARLRAAANALTFDCLFDIGFDFRGMAADARFTSGADRRVAIVDFLHHRADEAGKFVHAPRQNGLPERAFGERGLSSLVPRSECTARSRP